MLITANSMYDDYSHPFHVNNVKEILLEIITSLPHIKSFDINHVSDNWQVNNLKFRQKASLLMLIYSSFVHFENAQKGIKIKMWERYIDGKQFTIFRINKCIEFCSEYGSD